MKLKYQYANKIFHLTPYSGYIEKNILLQKALSKSYTLDDFLEILKNNISTKEDIFNLTIQEKKALLLKLRELSVGEKIPIKFKCQHCEKINDTELDISNVIEESNEKILKIGKKTFKILFCFEELDEDNLWKFTNKTEDYIDELSVEEFTELYDFVYENKIGFDFLYDVNCHSCKESSKQYFGDSEFIIENMSEDTLINIYKITNDLIFYGKYTKTDVESMIPFERNIFVELLNKTLETVKNVK